MSKERWWESTGVDGWPSQSTTLVYKTKLLSGSGKDAWRPSHSGTWKTGQTERKKGILEAYWNIWYLCSWKVLAVQLCLTLCDPMDCSLPGSPLHGILQARNTGVGSHSLLQWIFPTQGLDLGLPHCRQILYHLSQWLNEQWAILILHFTMFSVEAITDIFHTSKLRFGEISIN